MPTSWGYALSSEEHDATTLVRLAGRAEETGFEFAMISDHFHPWVDAQGHSPLVWAVLGGIAVTTERLEVGTGVTCPLVRQHPAVVAQAAMTVGEMMPGRFRLGLGTGEALNEHVTGRRWPPASVRLEMLEEAVAVIRRLFSGDNVDHHGRHYTVEGARVYCDPAAAPPVLVAAGGPDAGALAGRVGDGLVATSPDDDTFRAFDDAGGAGKPRFGQITVCWATSDQEARETAHRVWPNAAIRGQLGQELPMPSHFEQAATMVTVDDVARAVVCGPSVDEHVKALRAYEDAGFDHVYVHQVGPDQDGFFRFYGSEVLPALRA